MLERFNSMVMNSPDLLSLLHLLLAIKFWFYLGLVLVCIYVILKDQYRRRYPRPVVHKKSFEFLA